MFRTTISSIVVLLFSLLFISCGGDKKVDESKGKPKSITVTGVVLSPRDMENKIRTTGTVIANEEVEIRSETAGRIITINFAEGSNVSKGQLLGKIDDCELQAQLKKLQLEEKLAKDDVYRKEKLLELKAVSQEEYDISKNQLGIVQTGIDLVQAQIAKTEIYAPFSGKVGLRYISPGGFISSSTLIARLQQTDPVKIDFSIPEKYRSKIHVGSVIQFEVDGVDSTFAGRVYAIEPKIDPSSRNVPVRAICSNGGNQLVPGAFAKVQVLLDKITDALVVPSEAVIPQIDGEKVFIVKNGKVKSIIIQTGIRTDREVEATQGVQTNDTVVTSGLLQVKEGMEVKVKIVPGL